MSALHSALQAELEAEQSPYLAFCGIGKSFLVFKRWMILVLPARQARSTP